MVVEATVVEVMGRKGTRNGRVGFSGLDLRWEPTLESKLNYV